MREIEGVGYSNRLTRAINRTMKTPLLHQLIDHMRTAHLPICAAAYALTAGGKIQRLYITDDRSVR